MVIDEIRPDMKIEVVTTDIADLAMMGFGSIHNCRLVRDALAESCSHVAHTVISRRKDLDALADRHPDLIVAGIKYVDFTDACASKTSAGKIWLSQFLDDCGLLYTGSCREAIELDFNKRNAEQVIRRQGLAVADSFVALPGQYVSALELPVAFPLFVKPLFESDSKGIDQFSAVNDFTGFQAKVAQIHEDFKQPALAETYLPGREFTVAILATEDGRDYDVMPVELRVDKKSHNGEFLEFNTKHDNEEHLENIAEPDIRAQVAELALRAFLALGARDYGRIDIKMDLQGTPHFLEANLLPGMNADYSYFPIACLLCRGMSYSQVVHRMARAALNRQPV